MTETEIILKEQLEETRRVLEHALKIIEMLEQRIVEPSNTSIIEIENDKTLEKKVTSILQKLRLPTTHGYYYIKTAVIMVYKEPTYIYALYKLYPKIAEKHGVTAKGVEKAIRKVILSGVKKGNQEEFIKIFGKIEDVTKFKSKDFINAIVEKIKNDL